MSNAICTDCGKEYHWHNRRGYRLADFPSPCCNVPGKAFGDHKSPPKVTCPSCGKAGLRIRDDNGKRCSEMQYWRWKWCPRCHAWITPQRAAG